MTTKDQSQPKEEAASAAASGLKQKQQHLQEPQPHQRQPKGVADRSISSHEAVSRMMMMNSSS
eukprot:CAMPEP_0119559108 /NCGR_PEP_ID=MMETSP1352-20130426/11873_1 /TAXON_ID=265584 /ORGANISM="Stauroneis constricta, Strain CCMP1120" /LENGTH=62 /DNA_ID=CAMNT_0007606681 /DNA_START=91 /DNA_END=276 /DNA_ORIENTATION=+